MATIEQIRENIIQESAKLEWLNRYNQIGEDFEVLDDLIYDIENADYETTKHGTTPTHYKIILIRHREYHFFSFSTEEKNSLKKGLNQGVTAVETLLNAKAQEVYQEGVDNGYIDEIL